MDVRAKIIFVFKIFYTKNERKKVLYFLQRSQKINIVIIFFFSKIHLNLFLLSKTKMGRKCKISRRRKYSSRPAHQHRVIKTKHEKMNNHMVVSSNESNTLEAEKNVPVCSSAVDTEEHGEKIEKKIERKNNKNWEEQQQQRFAIAFVYSNLLSAPPPRDWYGRDGSIVWTIDYLGLHPNTYKTVREVFFQLSNQASLFRKVRGRNKNLLIPPGSVEEQIVADRLEEGCSISLTTTFVNQYREQAGKIHVSEWCVYNSFHFLKPVISSLKKRKQGNLDENSPWAKARNNWTKQLCLRFDVCAPRDLFPFPEEIPKPFSADFLRDKKVKIQQVVFWDETHKKVHIGKGSSRNQDEIRFPRDNNGKLDLKNGTYKKESEYLQVKYPEEVRLSLGVAQVELLDGFIQGKRAKPFVYSAKVLMSIDDFQSEIEKEIKRVRNLQGAGAPWYQNKRNGRIWESESLALLNGCGGKTRELLEKKNITSILHLKRMDDATLVSLKEGFLTVKKLRKLKALANASLPGAPPSDLVVNHTLSQNPYKSLYEENWSEKILLSKHMKKFVCITHLIEHIYQESERLMQGTKYQDNWYFYHDALTLMTSNSSITWMKENNYYDRWLLPAEINKGTRYYGRPVGNSPEMMPLDCTLNNDVDLEVQFHIAVTSSVCDADDRKFSLATPSRGTSAYLRVWENVPCSRRIIEDTNKFLKHIKVISDHKGCAVAGLGNRKGHRHQATQTFKKRGGRRVKKEPKVRWVHEDAKHAIADRIESSILLHQSDVTVEQQQDEGNVGVAVAAALNEEIMQAANDSTEVSSIFSTRPCEDWEEII